jgi:hypothetical protein
LENKMESVLRRILGLPDRNTAPPRAPVTYAANKDGTQRVQMYEDMTMGAIAAKHSAREIFGEVGPMFGMKSVIEVKQADGSWSPVTGSKKGVPDMETQIAMLQNYNETGKLGHQPLELGKEEGAVGQAGKEAQMGGKTPHAQRAEGGDKGAAPAAGAAPLIAAQLKLPWSGPKPSNTMLAAGLAPLLSTKKLGPSITEAHTPRAEPQGGQPAKQAMLETTNSHAARAEAEGAPQTAERPWMRNIGLGLY